MTHSNLEQSEFAAREQLGFPTERLSISDVIEASALIPEDVTTLNASQAEYLAGRFLKGFEVCGDLYAIAVGHEAKMEAQKREKFNRAVLMKSVTLGYKTAVDKTAYGYVDDEYLAAEGKYNEAKMFRLFVAQKHQTFEKAHYHMRKLADRDANMISGRPSMDSDTKMRDSERIDWEKF